MCTEIIPKATKKSRLDRITHYNIHMVLKIKEEERGAYVYEARKAYRKCRNKKAKKDFLDRFVEESGYNRKQAIRLLQKRQKKKETLRRGAPSKLHSKYTFLSCYLFEEQKNDFPVIVINKRIRKLFSTRNRFCFTSVNHIKEE